MQRRSCFQQRARPVDELPGRPIMRTVIDARLLPGSALESEVSRHVSEMLGHASAAFTLECVLDLLPHLRDSTAARVEKLWMSRERKAQRESPKFTVVAHRKQ